METLPTPVIITINVLTGAIWLTAAFLLFITYPYNNFISNYEYHEIRRKKTGSKVKYSIWGYRYSHYSTPEKCWFCEFDSLEEAQEKLERHASGGRGDSPIINN